MKFALNIIFDEQKESMPVITRKAVRGIIHFGNQILMVKTNRGDYKFPGGGIDAGENEKEALLREIQEETGYVDIEIGACIGTAFEQNIDTEDSSKLFQMTSIYYDCRLKSKKMLPGLLDDYEEKLGFRGEFVTVKKAYEANKVLFDQGYADLKWTGNDKITDDKEKLCIPWLYRETKVLEKMTKEFEEEILNQIINAVRTCGKIILNADRSKIGIDIKAGHANFVTAYDKQVQTELEKSLLEILPEAVFVGEEEDIHESIKNGYAFIVDPIDGTTNFIKDYHTSCISVGLTWNGEREMGVVYNPYLDEMFAAVKGKGAFLNGNPIHVSNQPLSNGIVLFGTAPYCEELNKKSFDMAYAYFRQALDVRRSGSASIDLCSIAAGRAELYFELLLNPWDYAAGALIVEEAGGKVTTVDGEEITLEKQCSVVATNGIAKRIEV